jgi:hypothetical protein
MTYKDLIHERKNYCRSSRLRLDITLHHLN